MKKLTLILALAFAATTFSSCKEESDFPYIPYEKEEQKIPSDGEDVQSQTINYRLSKVLLCEPANPAGIDLMQKFDFFGTVSMAITQSPTGIKAKIENGNVPFSAWNFEIPAEEFECDFDMDAVPNELRIKGTKTVVATYENDGFTVTFQLDSDQLTYKYKFQSF